MLAKFLFFEQLISQDNLYKKIFHITIFNMFRVKRYYYSFNNFSKNKIEGDKCILEQLKNSINSYL